MIGVDDDIAEADAAAAEVIALRLCVSATLDGEGGEDVVIVTGTVNR